METHSEILAVLWTSLGSTCSQGVVLVNGAQSTSLSHGGRTPARGRAVTLDSQVSPGGCGFAHAVLGPVSQLSCICGGQSEDRVVQKVKQAFPENRQVLEGAAGHLTWFLPIFQPFLALAGRATEAWPRACNRPLTLGSPPQAHLTPRRPRVLEAATETPPHKSGGALAMSPSPRFATPSSLSFSSDCVRRLVLAGLQGGACEDGRNPGGLRDGVQRVLRRASFPQVAPGLLWLWTRGRATPVPSQGPPVSSREQPDGRIIPRCPPPSHQRLLELLLRFKGDFSFRMETCGKGL